VALIDRGEKGKEVTEGGHTFPSLMLMLVERKMTGRKEQAARLPAGGKHWNEETPFSF